MKNSKLTFALISGVISVALCAPAFAKPRHHIAGDVSVTKTTSAATSGKSSKPSAKTNKATVKHHKHGHKKGHKKS